MNDCNFLFDSKKPLILSPLLKKDTVLEAMESVGTRNFNSFRMGKAVEIGHPSTCLGHSLDQFGFERDG